MRRFMHDVVASAVLIVAAFAAATARADIYTWVDANGVVNVSNLRPPAGAEVTHVTIEKPQAPPSRADAAREAARQAELQALNDRVRELEGAREAPQRSLVTTVISPVYVPVPAPLVVPYVQDVVAPVAPATYCDPTWLSCLASSMGYYGPNVIVLPTTPRRSSRLPKPVNGPVTWPTGNVAALGPWGARIEHKPLGPHRPQ